jgi:transposase
MCGQISPAGRRHLRAWLERFEGIGDVAFAFEACTGWRYVAGELARAGIAAHLAEPADTAAARGRITALALCCWLGGAGRFSSARKAVRFTGLDITVYSSAGKRSPGHLSRDVGRGALIRVWQGTGRTMWGC